LKIKVQKSTAFRDFHYSKLNQILRKRHISFSQKAVLKIERAKINCFLRFSIAIINQNLRKTTYF